LIDEIVSGVLKRLASGNGQPPNGSAPKTAAPKAAAPKSQVSRFAAANGSGGANGQANHVLHIGEAAITADVLRDRLRGQSRITIGPKAVLTPSAVDYLRQQNIAWERALNKQSSSDQPGSWKAVVLSDAARAESVARQLGWSTELVGCPDEAVGTAVSMLCRGEASGVVVLADRCHRVACRANRNHYVRAAVVADAGAADQAREELGANLFCVPPTGMAQFALLNLLRACGKVSAPKPPGNWNH
jgi:hypothetical protein